MPKFLLFVLLPMLVIGCAATGRSGTSGRSTDPASVVGTTWQWESTITPTDNIAVPSPERYTVLLTREGRAQIRFDCNRGGGDYRIGNGMLAFGPMLSTRMACPPDSLDSTFMRDLERVETFFLENDSLHLMLKLDSGTMRFRSIR